MSRSSSRAHIVEDAARWFVRLREGGRLPNERSDFAAWLLESPVHVHEYLAISQLYSDLAEIDPGKRIGGPGVPEKLGSSVVPLADAMAGDSYTGKPRAKKRSALRYSLAAGVAALAVAAAFLFSSDGIGPTQRYVTAVGEQRSIALADGSLINLNTRSELIVEAEGESRLVRLVRGEAFFDVHKDPRRPFIVNAGDAQVRVTGTRFNVYKEANGTSVTVVDGEVTVARLRPEAGRAVPRAANIDEATQVHLSIGEQARIAPHGKPIEKVKANIENVTAWQERRLLFEGQSLNEIVAEFNRYNVHRIEVADPRLARLRLSGTFASNDPASLLEFLRRIRSIEVVVQSDGTRIIKEHPASADPP